MKNRTLQFAIVAGVGLLVLALAPGAQGLLNGRTFLVPGFSVENPGPGWYHPTDPDTTCFGPVGVEGGPPGTYYGFRFGTNAGTTQVLPGTGPLVLDPTECFGPIIPPPWPGNVFGLEDTTVKVGTFADPSVQISATQFAVLDGTQTWTLAGCPVASASVVPGPAGIITTATAAGVTCSVAWDVLYDGGSCMSSTAPGSWSPGFGCAPFLHEIQVGTDHYVIVSCYEATLSTFLGVTTLETDQDHFASADVAALGGPSTVAWATWALTDTNWSNGAANGGCPL